MKLDDKIRSQYSSELIKRMELSYQLADELLNEQKIPDYEDYLEQRGDPSGLRCFKIISDQDVTFGALIPSGSGDIEIRFSLMMIANDILVLLENLWTIEKASGFLKKSVIHELRTRKISMLQLFNMEASEIDEVTRTTTKDGLRMFLMNLLPFAKSAVFDTLGHSKIGYLQNMVKPKLKDHWKTLRLPAKFDLITEAELNSVRKSHLKMKRWFVGDKKQLLDMNALADQADFLKREYKKAKSRFVECLESFRVLKRSMTDEEWKDKWTEIWTTEFPRYTRE